MGPVPDYEYDPRDEGRVAREDRQAGVVILLAVVASIVLIGLSVVMLVRG